MKRYQYDESGIRRLALAVVANAVETVVKDKSDYTAFHTAYWLEREGALWIEVLVPDRDLSPLYGLIDYHTLRRSIASVTKQLTEKKNEKRDRKSNDSRNQGGRSRPIESHRR